MSENPSHTSPRLHPSAFAPLAACCALLLLLFALLLSTAPLAHAQDDPGAAAPQLEENSFAAASIAALQKQLDDLLVSIESGVDSPTLRAQANLRAIAIAMLESSALDDPASNFTAAQAFTLISSLPSLDSSLRALTDAPPSTSTPEAPSTLSLLSDFNTAAANLPQLPLKPPAPDAAPTALNRMFALLLRALDPASTPAWPALNALPASTTLPSVAPALFNPADEITPPSLARLASLESALPFSPLSSAARTAASKINANIRLALDDPALTPKTPTLFSALSAALSLADLFSASTLLPQDRREFYLQNLNHIISTLASAPADRPQSYSALTRISHSALALHEIHSLAARNIDPAPLLAAIALADGDPVSPFPSSAPLIQQFILALQPLALSPPQDPPFKLKRDLLEVRHKLMLQLDTAREKILQALPRFATESSTLADPAASSMLDEFRTLARTINTIDRIPADIRAVTALPGIRNKVTSSLEDRLSRHARSLLEPAHRDDAAAALNSFHDDLARFAPLPAEPLLASPTAAILSITAGRQRELANSISALRIDWLDALAAGQPSSDLAQNIRAKLHARFTLMSAINSLAPLLAFSPDDPAHPLNRLNLHPAWHLSPAAVTRITADTLSRLKLAVAAAVQRDEDELLRLADLLSDDVPLLLLASRLAPQLQAPAPDDSPSTPSVLAQLAAPPSSSPAPALLDLSPALARISRYQLELEHALAHSPIAHQARLQSFITAIARDLLRSLPPPG